MQNQNDLTPAQFELEQTLRGLPPTSATLNALSAAFTAGRRSTIPRLRIFQSATAVLLAILIIPRPASHTSAPTMPPSIASTAPPKTLSNQSLWMLQQTLFRDGPNALPHTPMPPSTPLHAADAL